MPDHDQETSGLLAKTFKWYEAQPWLRAIVQAVPLGGGSIDTLLAWKGTRLNQERIEELFTNVSERLGRVEDGDLPHKVLQSEEYFEIFRSCAETAAHTASTSKRERLADFLSGTVIHGLDDLSSQFAEDLKVLQEHHLYVMSRFPREGIHVVSKKLLRNPRESGLEKINKCTYEKVVSDLLRLGFLEYDDSEGMWDEDSGGALFTTEYFRRFMASMAI